MDDLLKDVEIDNFIAMYIQTNVIKLLFVYK